MKNNNRYKERRYNFCLKKFIPESKDDNNKSQDLNNDISLKHDNSTEKAIPTTISEIKSTNESDSEENLNVSEIESKELQKAKYLEEVAKRAEERYKTNSENKAKTLSDKELEKNRKLVIENWNNHSQNNPKVSTKCNGYCCNPIIHSDGKLYCGLCKFTIKNWENHKISTIHLFNNNNIKIKSNPLYLDISNKGYELLYKNGWNIDKGLGRDESGRIEPIYTELKVNKTGVGYEKKEKRITHFPSHNEYEKKISKDGLSNGLRTMIEYEENRLKRKISVFSKKERKLLRQKDEQEKERNRKRIKFELIEDFK